MSDARVRAAGRAALDPVARREALRRHVRSAPDDVEPLLPYFELETWRQLALEDHTLIAELFARILAARVRPMSALQIAHYGQSQDQPVARFLDPATELVFALIPGGTFQPGLSEEELGALEAWGEFHEKPSAPTRTESVRVAPFLMSVSPIPACCAGLPDFFLAPFDTHEEQAFPASLEPRDVPKALRLVGAALPTTHQVEWAARGGRDWLFPWGDELDLIWEGGEGAVAIEFPRDLRAVQPWPRANDFGLIALGGVSIYCTGTNDDRLHMWGGAGMLFPWQGCGEWCLSAGALSRLSHPDDGVGLRPILPIGPRT